MITMQTIKIKVKWKANEEILPELCCIPVLCKQWLLFPSVTKGRKDALGGFLGRRLFYCVTILEFAPFEELRR